MYKVETDRHLQMVGSIPYEREPVSQHRENKTMIVACRTVAIQEPQDGQLYQGRFWATVTDRISHVAGFSIFSNIVNTQEHA
jgi:hypothetical protein